jgi:hypothetical protein
MPGMPITRASIEVIAAYGLDRILDRIANGEPLVKIAPEVGVSRPLLNGFLTGKIQVQGEPTAARDQRVEAYQDAKKMAAQSMVEDAGVMLDEEKDFRMAQLAKSRAEHRRWQAERLDRDQFGQPKQEIQVNIGVLHLDALRQRVIGTIPAADEIVVTAAEIAEAAATSPILIPDVTPDHPVAPPAIEGGVLDYEKR